MRGTVMEAVCGAKQAIWELGLAFEIFRLMDSVVQSPTSVNGLVEHFQKLLCEEL